MCKIKSYLSTIHTYKVVIRRLQNNFFNSHTVSHSTFHLTVDLTFIGIRIFFVLVSYQKPFKHVAVRA